MSKKRKVKLNYKNIFLACLFLAFIVFLIGKALRKSYFKVEVYDESITVNESGVIDVNFKATFKGKDVTSSVNERELVVKPKKDKYEITFKYNHNNKIYEDSKTIEIKDDVKPIITLKKGTVVVKKDGQYNEPGYIAYDNLDKNITNEVKTNSNVNLSKEGEYEITYSVSDSSGNSVSITRKVIVSSKTPLDMDLATFSLEGYFENTILKKTDDAGDEYAENFILAGDSTFLYYPTYHKIKGLWKKNGLTSEKALESYIDVDYKETTKTLADLFKEKKPEYVLLSLGENCVAVEELEFFIDNYKTLLLELKASSPNTIIIVQSILPVPKETSIKGKLSNEKINKFNYYIAELCEEVGVYFLNTAEDLKDEEGHLKSGFEHPTDTLHIGKNGSDVIFNYIKTHAIKK